MAVQYKIVYERYGRREFCVVDKKTIGWRIAEQIRKVDGVKWVTQPIKTRFESA